MSAGTSIYEVTGRIGSCVGSQLACAGRLLSLVAQVTALLTQFYPTSSDRLCVMQMLEFTDFALAKLALGGLDACLSTATARGRY